MSEPDSDSILPSVFDRLTTVSSQPRLRWSQEDLRNALIRDLQWMLDTRNWVLHERVAEMSSPQDSVNLAGSLLGYGLPDFTVPAWEELFGRGNSTDFFQNALYSAIREFEPRLEGVGVNPLKETPKKEARKLYFEVRASLKKPASARVVMQAVLNLYADEYTLKEE